MKFNLSDFLQLDTKELLAVNGGFNCNGSSNTTVYPNTYYPSTPGGAGSNLPSSSRAVVGSSIRLDGTIRYDYDDGSHLFVYPDGQRQFYPGSDGKSKENNGKDASSSSGGGSCSTSTSNNPNGQGPSTTSSNPGGNQHKDTKIHSGGGTCTKTGGHSPVNPNPTNPDDVTSGGGTCSGGSSSGGSTGDPDSTSTSGGTTETTQDKNALIQERLFRAIKKVGPHSYDIADETNPNEYRCDEYVADILERGGFNVYDYCVDDPVEKSVDDHYHDMLNKKLEMITDRNDLEQGASYILVMRDQDGILDSHIGLYINGGENGYCYVDNSGSNYGNLGGTETHKGANISEVLADYHNYEYMYFVKLK